MTTNTLVQIQRFRKNGLRFIPHGQGENYELPIELITLFERYEKNGFRVFAIDLVHVPHLTEEIIVLLLETSARLRRRGGDLYIFNLHAKLQEDLALFNPQAYLSVARAVSSPPHFEALEEGADPEPDEDADDLVPDEQAEKVVAPETGGLRKQVSDIEIPYSEDHVYKACTFVVQHAEQMGFSMNEISRIKIAVYEACLNAIQHSHKSSVDDNMVVEVERMGEMMQINVYDRGRGFRVDSTREYDVTEAASHRKTGGMGLHIIRKAMDKIDYQMDPIRGNKFIMIKYLKK